MEKVKDFFKQNSMYFLITIICGVYLLSGLIDIKTSGKTVLEILADSSVILIFGMSTTQLFDIQGILNGERNEKVMATNKLHAETVEGINEDINYLDEYCEMITKDTLKKKQIKYLNVAGIKYEDFINKTYNLDDLEPKDKLLAMKYIRKAKLAKITPLLSSELTSDDSRKEDPLNLGKTKKQYMSGEFIKGSINKVIVAVLFGYYTADLIHDFKWSSLIWVSLQIMIFLIFGVIKMMESYFFITDELRNRKIRKIDWLQKFKIWVVERKKQAEEDRIKELEELQRKKALEDEILMEKKAQKELEKAEKEKKKQEEILKKLKELEEIKIKLANTEKEEDANVGRGNEEEEKLNA